MGVDEASLLELVSEASASPGDGVRPDTRLEAIGFDSIAYAEFAAAVLERHGVDLVDGDVLEMRTAGELARYVAGVAAAQRRSGRPAVPVRLGRFQAPAMSMLGGLLRWWFDLEVHGAHHMPRSGPVVLCMNHESLLDIPVAVVASHRPITFMAKRELFPNDAAAGFWNALGGFSVDRDRFDLRAIHTALRVLERGEVLGMYPEGTRKPGVLLPFLLGAPWVALQTGAPLVPCGIRGTERAMPRGSKIPRRVPIRVRFEEPIEVDVIEDPVNRRAEAGRLAVELRSAVRRALVA
jgi:1-acyl-sn-glycerol-3-phosphate acyltransferase